MGLLPPASPTTSILPLNEGRRHAPSGSSGVVWRWRRVTISGVVISLKDSQGTEYAGGPARYSVWLKNGRIIEPHVAIMLRRLEPIAGQGMRFMMFDEFDRRRPCLSSNDGHPALRPHHRRLRQRPVPRPLVIRLDDPAPWVGGKKGLDSKNVTEPRWQAYLEAGERYGRVRDWLVRGRFVGIDEWAHLHVLAGRPGGVLVVFNMSEQPVERTILLKSAGLGLGRGDLRVSGARRCEAPTVCNWP